MKILLAIAAIVCRTANGVHQQADIHYHEKTFLGPSMWHFGPDGLAIYSPSGSLVKIHRKISLCKPYRAFFSGEVTEECYYFAAASDGHRHVWAASLAGEPRLDVFDVDTGEYAGYVPTCSTPIDLEYQTSRREMWVRCAQESEGHEGEIEVFSSASLSARFEAIALNDTTRPYGRFAIHSKMGPYGYASAYDQNYISELDLSSKKVIARHPLPGAYGTYDVCYSPANEHLFARARICCTCGEGKDAPSCGAGDPANVLVTTGPSQSGAEQPGICGAGCEGSAADTIGVFEFDTVGKSLVSEHNILEGTGYGADPVASPDGRYVLLLPNDGGKYVRLVRPGANGKRSTVVHDIPVDFKGGTRGRTVVSDFAFVNDRNRNLLVLAASTDNDVVLVDLNANFETRKLALTAQSESTGGLSRGVEWAVGTDFVWVSGGEAREQYVIEIPGGIHTAKIVATLSNVASGQIIFVDNYERRIAIEAMKEQSAFLSRGMEEGQDPIGEIALSVGCVALLLALVLATLLRKYILPKRNSNPKSNDVQLEDVSLQSSQHVA